MKGYIIQGCYYSAEKVYINKEAAEKACEKINYNNRMGGSRESVYVKEIEIVTEEEEGN